MQHSLQALGSATTQNTHRGWWRQVSAQLPSWRSKWRGLVALLLLAGFSGQTWAHCPATMSLTVASGGTVVVSCENWSLGTDGDSWIEQTATTPAHGSLSYDVAYPSSGDFAYTNNGSGTTDAFRVYRGDAVHYVDFTVTITQATTVPGTPTIGTAAALDASASVAFTAPASDGGSAITGYTAKSSPGNITSTCTSSPCSLTGLTSGTPYTFTVTATNAQGTSAASAASNSVIPKASQTITFSNPGTQIFGATPTLTATASSGLVVSFSSATIGVCTVTNGVLNLITTGTCTIDADQAGNAAFSSAPQVAQSFNVSLPAGPAAANKAVSTAYNTPVAIDLSGSITGAAITGVTIGTAPTHGTISISGMTVTYTPSSTFFGGADSFTYTATNAAGTSAPATVTITVGTPALPTAANKSLSTAYNTLVSIDLAGSITGAGITGVTIGTAPTHGTISISGMTVTYTPSSTFFGGADSFTYTATNAAGTSAPATVTITVGPMPNLIVPEGPRQGEGLGLALAPSANNWVIESASTAVVASTGTSVPNGVTLLYGLVKLKLTTGTAGTSATVVLTYPQTLPAGTQYYKFGVTAANPTPHWYVFSGAVINGNSIQLTLTDGGAGDNDLVANSVIEDPGGPAMGAMGATAIPVDNPWALAALSALVGGMAWRRKRRVLSLRVSAD